MTQEQNTSAGLDDDLFAAGFDEVSGGGETPVIETPVIETPVVETPVVETPVVEIPVVEIPTAPQPSVEEIVAKALAAAKAAEPVKPVEAPPRADTRTAEEIAAEEQYRKDWPEHSAREDRLKSDLSDVRKLLQETTEALKGQIAPVVATAAQTAEEKHYKTILDAHSDALDIVPAVQEWVKMQPKFLQPHYNTVLESGSASDVVELFTTYKAATANPEAEKKIATEAVQAAEAQRKKDNEDRLKRMQTPSSVRTSVTAEDDPSDFDSAFEAEVKKFKAA